MMPHNIEITLTRQDYIDELADIKAELQHAQRVGNKEAIRLCTKDMIYCEQMLKTF